MQAKQSFDFKIDDHSKSPSNMNDSLSSRRLEN